MQRLAGRILLLDGWRRGLAAFLAGAFATLALAPYDVPAVGFVSFPVLVWLLDGAAGEPGRGVLARSLPAFAVGWCFGFGYFLAGLWWLGAAMLVDAGAFLWALPLAVLVLPAILALYHGLAAVLARALWSDGAGRLFALAGAFALSEWLRGVLFTGFPWNEIGVMAATVPLAMQSVSVVGLHALTLAAILVFSLPALLLRGGAGWGRPAGAFGVLLVIAHLGFGAARLGGAETEFVEGVAVRMVQPNILQSQKWDAAEAERIFQTLLQLTAERGGPVAGAPAADAAPAQLAASGEAGRTLVVWPESAFPFLLTERPDAVARLADTLQPGETLLAGATRVEDSGGETRYYNSVTAIDDNAAIVDARDKIHLVPFGEYLPFQETLEGLGISQLTELPGGFSAGSGPRPMALDGAPAMLPLICYEVIFQDEIAVPGGAERPGFILNVTNDAWYGRTPGPYQHLRHAELTAVAFGLPLVRAANTGISVVSDAYGRTLDGLDLGVTGAFEARLPTAAAPTPFSRFGSAPFWAALAAFLALAASARFVRRR